MILLATNRRDVTTDFVVLELERRGMEFFRLNTEDIHTYHAVLPNGDPGRLRLEGQDRTLDLRDITGAYYRRPMPPDFEERDPATAEYLQAEWSALLRSIWNALDGRWLNCPFAILRAEDKPRQLTIARRLGFNVPETLVTNHPDHAIAFSERGGAVAKPLRHALIDDGERGKVIFTSRLGSSLKGETAGIELAPVILQEEVRKRSDVRVIVVDDQVFATAIDSQDFEETAVDWRRGVRTDLVHRATALPGDVERACVAVTRALGLRYSAIDLVEDKDGEYWFLEANPNGQWAWIEQRTGAPISAAIAKGLSA
ncbi:Ribosomal protein S6 modification protein [Croceibacterium atlanticum]|uniref:Ribosomal protein S6 modification protein n=1 Tax=Croceibacterium atlanticum TaxID=1267766 RepID=A0A0F7KW57_9SPHN|nr:ATP-dependent carboxylate-amine ligase [Croceibacterium atlanticum]AKH43020.1 Ribosomal protein S6 modification protein [Croceibacterium atlanticum]